MPPKERCPAGSRRNADTGKCVKTKKNTTTSKKAPLKRCPAGSRRDKDTQECVPTSKSKTPTAKKTAAKKTAAKKTAAKKTAAKKTSSLPKDIREKLEDVEEFYDVYEEENASLISNVRGGHKKGVLNKLFSSAKKALSGIVRMIGSPYFIVLLCIAIAVYTGIGPAAGKEMAIKSLSAINGFKSSIGGYIGSYFPSIGPIPAKYPTVKDFVIDAWREMWMYRGVGKFFNVMGDFMGQVNTLLQTSRAALGVRWTWMLDAIKGLYGQIMAYASSYYPAIQGTMTSLSQKYTSLTPYQQDTLKDSGTLAAGVGIGSSLGYLFGRKRTPATPVKPVVAPKKRR